MSKKLSHFVRALPVNKANIQHMVRIQPTYDRLYLYDLNVPKELHIVTCTCFILSCYGRLA